MSLGFFEESTEQSQAKASIVSKYFDAWAKVITRRPGVDRVAYFDLFAGPGRYKDGTVSTPLLVLQKAVQDPGLSQKLVAVFNDVNAENTQDLERAISRLPGIENLKHPPRVFNEVIGENTVSNFGKAQLIPTLFFVDPWGYKGLSLGLVNAVVKDWACECIFFFNYNRISMGLPNELVEHHMNALFGEDLATELRNSLYATSQERELSIVEALCRALNPDGRRYVLPFAFKNSNGTRTSHHLIFVSKHELGYTIMKEIMAKESTSSPQGVPSFTYNPADDRQPLLLEYARPLDDLAGMLSVEFSGMTLTIREIYHKHHIGRRFIERNYKDAIMRLESSQQVTTTRTEAHKKRGQCPSDKVVVTFPEAICG